MKCPKCQFDNPEGKRFCGQCDVKMQEICVKCNSSNPLRFKFCGECGHNLTEPTEPAVPALDSERKYATILFSDLVGYTAMTERLDPDDVKDIMSRIFQEIGRVVTKYEGVIERFFGDEVMVLFGVPKAHEDDPVRAIRAAREIHRVVESMSPEYEKEIGHPLAMHAGINTGLLITGDEYIGKGRHGLTGDAVNLAARLTKLAQSGETLVGQETYRQAEGYFVFEHLERKRVKGKAEPIEAYQVIASSTRRTRFEVSAQRGLSPLIGRKSELEQLQVGFQRCKEGSGGAFSIISEAGFGKSRLLYEFRKAVAREDVTFLEGKCLSYGKAAAYQPVIEILKSTFDIIEGDGDSKVRDKVIKGLHILGADETSTLPYLLELLSVKDSGTNRLSMSPEGKKDRIIQALKRIVIRGSEIRPVILAIEDLHWIDNSSEAAFKDLLESLAGTRILIIFTYRPEYVPSWTKKSYHNQIYLNRLSEKESLSMLTNLLGTSNIDISLEELVTGKTEGAPFFMEELIKSLKDLKIIEKKDKYYLVKNIEDITIPSTIHDVIMARVDLLPEGSKKLLQTGSVIEREFSYELLNKVSGFSDQALHSHLSALRDSELAYERGIFPQTTYIFKHALTRDVVYESILRKRRKKLHGQIGDAIEELYKDTINQHFEVLAEHYIANENYKKGARYSKLAGKKAQKAASFKDASEFQKMSVNCLEKLPQTEKIQEMTIDARTTLANYHLTLTHHVEAKDAVEPVMDLALKLNYRKGLPGIYTAIGLHALWVEEDYSVGVPYIDNTLRIAEEVGDFLSLWTASLHLGSSLIFQCEFERALSHLQKSLSLSELANNALGVIASKSSIILAYNFQGDISLACKVSEEATHLADEIGDMWSTGWAYTHYGCALYYKGDFDEARKYLLEGLNYTQKVSFSGGEATAAHSLGNLFFEMGEFKIAQDNYNRGIKALERAKIYPSWINILKTYFARAQVRTKEPNVDLHELFKCFENNKLKAFKGWIANNIGDILLQMGDEYMVDAEVWIKKAIEADRRNGTRWYLATDHVLYGDWFKRKGDLASAKEQLTRAIEIFRECGADGWVNKYEEIIMK